MSENNSYTNQTSKPNNQSGQTDAREQVRKTTEETVNNAKQKAHEVAAQVETQAGKLSEQVKEKASEATAQLRSTAESTFDEQKNRTVQQADGIADALRQSSKELRSNNQEAFAHYTDMAAEQVDHFSGYVQSKGFGDIVNDIQQLAQRQPELFVAGLLAGGFLLGRFIKSSQRSPRSNYRSQFTPGNQAYREYYETNRQSPYPSGGYPQYGVNSQYSSQQRTYGQSGSETPAVGATAFNGQRSQHGANRSSYGSDPAVTGADWGADYTSNEYGQSKPASSTQEREKNKDKAEAKETVQ